jgi:hypothetical protein
MPSKKPVITLLVDEELMERIKDFRFGNRIDSKSEALRLLIEKGLEDFENDDSGK